jgi:hypothetical protein
MPAGAVASGCRVRGAGCARAVGWTVVDELWGSDATRIRARLREAASWDNRFAIADAALGRRLEAGRALDPEVSFAGSEWLPDAGAFESTNWQPRVGWSRKRLWSRFLSQVGITPKRRDAAGPFPPRPPSSRRSSQHRPGGGGERLGRPVPPPSRDVMTFTGMTPNHRCVAPWLAVDDIAWPTRAQLAKP